MLTASPDQTLSPPQVHRVPACILHRGQRDRVDPDRGRVAQHRRHDGALQDPGLPVRGHSARRDVLQEAAGAQKT